MCSSYTGPNLFIRTRAGKLAQLNYGVEGWRSENSRFESAAMVIANDGYKRTHTNRPDGASRDFCIILRKPLSLVVAPTRVINCYASSVRKYMKGRTNHVYMRKSQKSSTYLHPKMLKIFFEGSPSRQGYSHLIGHNIYENACVQLKTTWWHRFRTKSIFLMAI